MKKIIKEWKRWLSETKETEKFMYQPEKPEGASDHHRRMPDFYRGGVKNTLKVAIKNYFVKTSSNIMMLSKLFKQLNDYPSERDQVAKILITIHHIYTNRDSYVNGLLSSFPASSYGWYTPEDPGYLFDDQPIIKSKDPAKAFEPIAKMMGDMKVVKDYLRTKQLPSGISIDQVLSDFVSQNVANARTEQPPKVSRFASRAAGLADFYSKRR